MNKKYIDYYIRNLERHKEELWKRIIDNKKVIAELEKNNKLLISLYDDYSTQHKEIIEYLKEK